MDPYRSGKLIGSKKPLPRFRARMRGLFRRVLLPLQVIAGFFGISALVNGCWMSINIGNSHDIDVLEKQVNARCWAKEQALKVKEQELDARLHTFEDMLRFFPTTTNLKPQEILDQHAKVH